jgi:hypothetical protein
MGRAARLNIGVIAIRLSGRWGARWEWRGGIEDICIVSFLEKRRG